MKKFQQIKFVVLVKYRYSNYSRDREIGLVLE
jgi:hypothetical protein